MITQETRLEAVAHVVHDYANLVSSGTIALSGQHLGKALDPPVNTHVADAFLMNCRKMREFFRPSHSSRSDDITASLYVGDSVEFDLSSWIQWHDVMHKQLMHLTAARVTSPQPWDGRQHNADFLREFMGAWRRFREALPEPYKSRFEYEITVKAQSEFSGLDLA